MIQSLLIIGATLFLCSCANSDNEKSKILEEKNAQYHFSAVGYAPIASQIGESFDLKMLNAIKASKLEAYKELAEQIYGVLLSAENSVSGSRLQKDQIESQVKGLVRGAKVMKSYHEGDIYITELVLTMQSLSFLQMPEFNASNNSVIEVKKQVYY